MQAFLKIYRICSSLEKKKWEEQRKKNKLEDSGGRQKTTTSFDKLTTCIVLYFP